MASGIRSDDFLNSQNRAAIQEYERLIHELEADPKKAKSLAASLGYSENDPWINNFIEEGKKNIAAMQQVLDKRKELDEAYQKILNDPNNQENLEELKQKYTEEWNQYLNDAQKDFEQQYGSNAANQPDAAGYSSVGSAEHYGIQSLSYTSSRFFKGNEGLLTSSEFQHAVKPYLGGKDNEVFSSGKLSDMKALKKAIRSALHGKGYSTDRESLEKLLNSENGNLMDRSLAVVALSSGLVDEKASIAQENFRSNLMQLQAIYNQTRKYQKERNQYLEDEERKFQERMNSTGNSLYYFPRNVSAGASKGEQTWSEADKKKILAGVPSVLRNGVLAGVIHVDGMGGNTGGTGNSGNTANGTNSSDSSRPGIHPSRYGDNPFLIKVGRNTGRFANQVSRYGLQTVSSTHVGRGVATVMSPAMTYVISPLFGATLKASYRAAAKRISSKFVREHASILKDQAFRGAVTPFLKGKGPEIFSSRKAGDVQAIRRAAAAALKARNLPTDKKELKKLIEEGALTQTEKDLATVYLNSAGIDRFYEYGKIHVARNIKNAGKKLSQPVKRKMREFSNDNSTMKGLLFSTEMATRSVRMAATAGRKTVGTVKETASVVKQAADMTKSAKAAAKMGGEFTSRSVRSMGKQSRKVLAAGGNASKKVFQSGERLAETLMKQSIKAAKDGHKVVSTTAKATAKLVRATTTAISFVINLAMSILSMIIAATGVVGLVAIFSAAIIAMFFSIFMLDGDVVDTADEEYELTVQQYIDTLVSCHEQFKEDLSSANEDGKYETVTVKYKDKKDEAFYYYYRNSYSNDDDDEDEEDDESSDSEEDSSEDTEEEDASDEEDEDDDDSDDDDSDDDDDVGVPAVLTADNNIKECLCMMSVLFDFDLESYSLKDEDEETILANDDELLETFLEKYDFTEDDYDGTFQALIRNYLIALFNGSHRIQATVSLSYCSGCTERETTYVDENGDEQIGTEYYCPGHRDLNVTVTTYYFPYIFDCELLAESETKDIEPTLTINSLVGSSTAEKLWNGLIDAGFGEAAAAGVIGNLYQESNLNPTAVNSSSGATGLAQWLGDRLTKLKEYEDWDTVDVQCAYLIWECESGGQWSFYSAFSSLGAQSGVTFEEFKELNEEEDVQEAALLWCAYFERCGTSESNMSARYSYAQSVYDLYVGTSSSSLGGESYTGDYSDTTYLGNYLITFYCPCYECSEGYGNSTSSGATATANHTIEVAKDGNSDGLKNGDRVVINGTIYTVEDVGGGVQGKQIDIYVDTHAETLSQGYDHADVYLIND